jgi:DNA invertase Pin-like site-specific DNA recombinase
MTARQVVGYVRVSKETEAGLSIDAQTAKIRAMAEVRGVSVAELFTEDGRSAKSLDRPEMARLLARVQARVVGQVFIAKLDRLTRSLRDLCDLLDQFERWEVGLVSIAESLDTRSSAGRLVTHIMGSVADWERREIGLRTRDVLQFKRTQGERTGTCPFGTQVAADGVHLEPAPVEQRLLAHLWELRSDGLSTRQIADVLWTEGWQTRRGTAWRFQNVAHLLRRGH